MSPADNKCQFLCAQNPQVFYFCMQEMLRNGLCLSHFSLRIDYPPLYCEQKLCKAAATPLYPPPPTPPAPFCAQCHQSALASELLCLHPANVCSNKPIVPARTTPFTAAPMKVAGRDEFFFLRNSRRGGGSGGCGNAPKVSRSTSSGAELLCRPGACRSLLVA